MQAREQLQHLTTADKTEPMETERFLPQSGICLDPMEECDNYYEAGATLKYFDGLTNKFTHSADISTNKCLGNLRVDASTPRCIVLRNDVDALVWQPRLSGELPTWRHESTFNAFGYVLAGKTSAKMTAFAPDSSYVAFCESKRRLHIYRQNWPLADSNVLTNRKEGKRIKKISTQQTAVLDSNNPIHGIHASNEMLFVLTSGELFVLKMACDQAA